MNEGENKEMEKDYEMMWKSLKAYLGEAHKRYVEKSADMDIITKITEMQADAANISVLNEMAELEGETTYCAFCGTELSEGQHILCAACMAESEALKKGLLESLGEDDIK